MSKGNRSLVLAAGMVIQFCAGIIYMWSVFRQPVAQHLSWDASAAALTSSIMLTMFVLGIIFGGRAQDVFGPKKVTIVGSIMISAGMILTASVNANAPWLIYLTYGILGGLGVGVVYTATVSVVQKWFPDRRGFSSGMIVSAFGFSLVVFAPLANYMLAQMGVPSTFLIFGIGFLIVCVACSLLIDTPPEGFIPGGTAAKGASDNGSGAAKPAPPAQKQYTTGEMLRTRQYYLLAGGLLFTLPAYFIINPLLLSLGGQRGLSDFIAVFGVMLTGVGSASGRLLISWASDKIGRKMAMYVISLLMLAGTLLLIIASGVVFLACVFCIAFAFGGAASVYAASTAESFGTKHMGMNFGMVMLGFGVSSLIFPIISSRISQQDNYTVSFVLAAATCVISLVLIAMMKKPEKA